MEEHIWHVAIVVWAMWASGSCTSQLVWSFHWQALWHYSWMYDTPSIIWACNNRAVRGGENANKLSAKMKPVGLEPTIQLHKLLWEYMCSYCIIGHKNQTASVNFINISLFVLVLYIRVTLEGFPAHQMCDIWIIAGVWLGHTAWPKFQRFCIWTCG